MTRLLFIALMVPRLASAQALQPLGASQSEHPFAFSSVTQLRELRDGRVIVVDSRERTVMLLDFATRDEQRIGREGAGPREIQQPTYLLPLPGDTTAIWDGQHTRLFFIGPDGSPLRTDRMLADDGRPLTLDFRAPRFADSSGRIYFDLSPIADSTSRDSLRLVRFDRRTARVDTVGSVRRPASEPATIGPPGQQHTIALTNPFSPRQDWFVTPDGRVGVLRSPEYRLDWTYPRAQRGPEVAYTPLPVTDEDKEHWRTSQRSMVVVRDPNARGRGPSVSMIPEPRTWPAHKPAFLGNAVQVDPLGRVWVQRAGSLADATVVYDVFDSASRVVRRVSVPRAHRIVGFGRDVVYTTRADADDLLRLNRHPMPR